MCNNAWQNNTENNTADKNIQKMQQVCIKKAFWIFSFQSSFNGNS